jgi:hemolysin III
MDGSWGDMKAAERLETLGEEIASSVSHGVGLAAAAAAAPFLLMRAARRGPSAVVASSVFVATVILLYVVSTLYHALPPNAAKRVFRRLDHSAIFLLIAGTYTPITLVVLKGAIGWTFFAAVWWLGAAGIVVTCLPGERRPALTTALYVGMGWMIVVAARPLWLAAGAASVAWLVAGGIAYTAGVGFYAARKLPYAHLVFHLFVVAGTACHFVAILSCAA